MTLQPVLLRELRGASRRLMTRRMRFWAAALAVGASLIAIAKGSAGPGISTFANSLFGVQAAYAFLPLAKRVDARGSDSGVCRAR